MPKSPAKACPVCRRLHCEDASHKPKPFATAAPTCVRRPEYAAQRTRRRAAVKAWLAQNSVPTEDGKRAAICPECGQWRTAFVADHLEPIALGGAESGELGVHCTKCSWRQGGVVANAKRKARTCST